MTPANPLPATGHDLPTSPATRSACPPICLGALHGRCLFRNHCLCVRLLELPVGREAGGWFAGSHGWLVVSFGKVEVGLSSGSRVLHEGESCPLERGEMVRVQAQEWADVLFFEETRPGGPSNGNSPTKNGKQTGDKERNDPVAWLRR